jgi:hypothetical protein
MLMAPLFSLQRLFYRSGRGLTLIGFGERGVKRVAILRSSYPVEGLLRSHRQVDEFILCDDAQFHEARLAQPQPDQDEGRADVAAPVPVHVKGSSRRRQGHHDQRSRLGGEHFKACVACARAP